MFERGGRRGVATSLLVVEGSVCFVLLLLMATNGIPGSSLNFVSTRLQLDHENTLTSCYCYTCATKYPRIISTLTDCTTGNSNRDANAHYQTPCQSRAGPPISSDRSEMHNNDIIA